MATWPERGFERVYSLVQDEFIVHEAPAADRSKFFSLFQNLSASSCGKSSGNFRKCNAVAIVHQIKLSRKAEVNVAFSVSEQ